ncbi:MAG: amino acid racemase [Acetobacteraceae bacterium]
MNEASRIPAPARQPVVGVVGGMGPEATVELMRRVIRATPARDDADHIRMIVDNNPKVPSRIAALIEGTGEDPGPTLAAMARGLEAAGADFLVIPCNTAHHYLPVVRAAVSIPVLDMIALTLDRFQSSGFGVRIVGLLASPAVRITALFESRCRSAGLSVIYPEGDHEAAVLEVIRAVKAGSVGDDLERRYVAAAERLLARGADVLVIACTELSSLDSLGAQGRVPVIDTLDVLVEATVARCLADPVASVPSMASLDRSA